jgi:pyruvyltransferase
MKNNYSINLSWWIKQKGENFGDALNPILAQHISGKTINLVEVGDPSSEPRYYCIGSILQSSMSTESEIWGTGLMRHESKLKVTPKKIYAVRGPLTRKSLIEQGFDCPEVYGDPALLYPKFYNPSIEKKYKWGIIPHYVDQKVSWLDKFKNNADVKIINILDHPNKVIDDIKSCEKIISSALHGIIAADAYGIPAKWIKLSDDVAGNGFKFMDYFASVKRTDVNPLYLDPNLKTVNSILKSIENQFVDYKIDIDLEKLLSVCPFKQ